MYSAQTFMNDLFQPFPELDAEKREKLFTYLQLVLETNRTTNLTAITSWEEAVVKHLYDSLVVIRLTAWAEWPKILDLGSGAGLPAVPLAITYPQQSYHLVEASRKKADFLHRVKAQLQLENIFIYNDRAENLAHQKEFREQYPMVTARAVAETAALLELTIPFCVTGGFVLAYKGPNYQTEIEKAKTAQDLLKVELKQELSYQLPLAMGERTLLLFQKTGPTLDKYPRRPGVPAKRPL
ncbi:MAG TPA: 16S rRNA (guanine(527)-N(7))-methyltransferase RsmG [Firmicutes bacterium]|nr:16S rRNA (guanine(527)-N(7))-methyltransferase RsmG [Bacillota bacterium]